MKATAKSKKRTGKTIDRYDNGKIRYSGYLKDGKMHGKWRFFRKDGSLMRSGSFIGGQQSGVWRTYGRNGKLIKETVFKKK